MLWIDRVCFTSADDVCHGVRDGGDMISVQQFIDTFLGTVMDVIPIAVIIFGFQLAVLRKPVNNLAKVLIGFFYVILGLSLFLMGLELALFL